MSRRIVRLARIAAALWVVPTVATAAWESREIAGMSVEIYTPTSHSPIGAGRALMIPLHGCTQTAVQLRDFGNFEHTADDLGVVIAIPLVPDGGVVAGCWNYYGSLHTRSNGHNGNLIALAETLRDDGALEIDPTQIYLAGFSAGGGQALAVGCLAPELFAGVGVAAGPSLGTSVNQISQVGTTGAAAAALCTQLAGAQAGELATQLAVTFTDTGDFTVAQGYQAVNAEMYATVYGAPLAPVPFDMAGLPGVEPAGMGNTFDDGDGPRVASMISTSGSGHAWPSGSGMPGLGLSFVAGDGLDFARYLAEFFAANARRADGQWDPGEDTGGGDTGGPSDDGGSEGDSTDGGGSSAVGDDSGDGDEDAADGGSSATVGQGDGYIEPSGCQCEATPPRGVGIGVLVLVALGVPRRARNPDVPTAKVNAVQSLCHATSPQSASQRCM